MIIIRRVATGGGHCLPPPCGGQGPQMKILSYYVMFKALKLLKDTALIISSGHVSHCLGIISSHAHHCHAMCWTAGGFHDEQTERVGREVK